MEKKLVVVDAEDNKIGEISKAEAHRKGVLHRAFSVFLYHDGKLLLQQRAFGKYHSGGLWANTCCSHPTTEDICSEAKKRLFEEVGIKCDKLQEIFKFTYFSKFADDLFEHEIDHVFVGDYDGQFEINKNEVNDMQWITFEQIETEMKETPKKFATWFLIAAPKVLKYLKKQQK